MSCREARLKRGGLLLEGVSDAAWEQHLQTALDHLPEAPGVYQFFDAKNRVLYVGKARLLKRRVNSYFRRVQEHSPRIARMVSYIRRLEYTVTSSEAEALILEANLIKSLNPRWNILFRDDKTYPYIKLWAQKPYPWVEKTRRVIDDGGLYFGPFTNGTHVYRVLQFLDRAYPLVKCNTDITARPTKLCLEYQIGRCVGPCEKEVDSVAYEAQVQEVREVLEGNILGVQKRLDGQMRAAAADWKFEQAAEFRDLIEALKVLQQNQSAEGVAEKNEDYFAVASHQNHFLLQHLVVREGRIVDQFKTFGEKEDTETDLLRFCIEQRLLNVVDPPAAVLLEQDALGEAELQILDKAFRHKFGRRVALEVPVRGRRRRLLEMTVQNAMEGLRVETQKNQDHGRVLLQTQTALGLKSPPYHIECFDISNIQGTDAVASMVVCIQAKMEPSRYRRFKIRVKETPDDFAMMQEAVHRRYARLLAEEKSLPDLIMVDGGIGQLRAAREALQKLGIGDHPLCSLAKREELIHISPYESCPIQLGSRSPVRFLFQRIRDEAHRFAITYHKQLRRKRTLKSRLEDVPGLGPKTRQKILRQCSDMRRLSQMSPSELKGLGLSDRVARNLFEYLQAL